MTKFAPFTLTERRASLFWRKVAIGDAGKCWPWTGYQRDDGYGEVSVGNCSRIASRVAYYAANGEYPDGFVCHTCDNPICCNPMHLWLGDNRQNQTDASRKGRQRGQSKKHCKNGHTYDEANTYWRSGKTKSRGCRACMREAQSRYQARRRAA